jgi:hypothetical protein
MPSLPVVTSNAPSLSRKRAPPGINVTFSPAAGLPSARKRNFAGSLEASSSGCVTGTISSPLPVVSNTVVVGAPAVTNTLFWPITSVSLMSVALAGISATVATLGRGWKPPGRASPPAGRPSPPGRASPAGRAAAPGPPGPPGPRRPPTRHSTSPTLKLPITIVWVVPIFHVPGLSSFTSNTARECSVAGVSGCATVPSGATILSESSRNA